MSENGRGSKGLDELAMRDVYLPRRRTFPVKVEEHLKGRGELIAG